MCKERTPVIVIAGPTASGKTKISIDLAKKFNGEIISADSKQIYIGMDIATAVPSMDERSGIPHHLMAFLDADNAFSVADYVKVAKDIISDINKRGKTPILVGGTGLYIDSLLNNIEFSEIKSDPKLREQLRDFAEKNGGQALLSMLYEIDKEYANKLHENDVLRIIRAIEIYKITGKTMTEQLILSRKNSRIYDPCIIGLDYKDRSLLYDRINRRVDQMIEMGIIEEANEFSKKNPSKTAVSAIGHKELRGYLNGEEALSDALEKLKRETRRYAKRQLTWFRKNDEINWIYIDEMKDYDDVFDTAVKIINDSGILKKKSI